MNQHYNQNYTREQIDVILAMIQDCVREGRFIISKNENRQENIDFINEYNLNSRRQTEILLKIKTEDFCHSLRNTKIGFEHEVLYVFCPQVMLFNFDGIEEIVDFILNLILLTVKVENEWLSYRFISETSRLNIFFDDQSESLKGGRLMNRNKTFCEECRRDVEYMVKTASIKGKLKGEEYAFIGKKAVCTECGGEVYVADIEDENLRALYDMYRQKNGIISLEKILEIPQKYNIGKRPLSLLLGWGEMTFSRYCEGDMPTKQYSDILQKIYDDPAYYKELLEKNKDNLKSLHAYEKSKRKVQELLGEENNTGSKIDLIIQYLLYKCEDITPLSLQKALYYVQGFHYAFEGRFLFDEDCEAWVHGPVYRDVYNRYSSYRFDPIESVESFDESVFATSEKSILDSVIKNFCCYSGKTLEKFTHLEKPWRHTRGGLPVDTHSNRIISKELIGEYFIAVKEKFRMLTPGDIEGYSKVIFEQIN